jgi:hypothetical protein
MNDKDRLDQYLELGRRIQLRMLRDGTWHWPPDDDSPNPENVIDSNDV